MPSLFKGIPDWYTYPPTLVVGILMIDGEEQEQEGQDHVRHSPRFSLADTRKLVPATDSLTSAGIRAISLEDVESKSVGVARLRFRRPFLGGIMMLDAVFFFFYVVGNNLRDNYVL